ncbi:unnamed protein product [Nippostrongylus brasiliensis]|uniref:Prion-like-(Q/N-rich) domain-bearing protein 25 n=1 Tax=Nippostrongylus brasiliensis TaxID=27835 RepID=A0A0N4XXI7_NIPBR|nr:unnamed protein product [Nippostrongylus brasiliensis]
MKWLLVVCTVSECGTSSSPQLTTTGQTVQCQWSNDCRTGFTCSQGVCCASANNPTCSSGQCPSGQVYVNGQCWNTVAIGYACQLNEQCRSGSQCINSICQCPYGSNYVNGQCTSQGGGVGNNCELGMVMINGRCVSLASPGMTCQDTQQCIDSSQCLGNTCTCYQGYSLINGYCIKNTGGPCRETQTLINNQCVTYSVVSGPCLADQQCVGGSACQNSVCQCKAGFVAMYGFCIADTTNSQQCGDSQVLMNGQCLPTAAIGGQCSYTQQCLGNSACRNSYCQCQSGSRQYYGMCSSPECGYGQVYVNGQCYPVVMVGGQCSVDAQCASYARCSYGYCKCPNGGSTINGLCSQNNNTGTCKSYQVYVNNQCLDTVSIGQSCSNDKQCVANAICSRSICQCSSNYHYDGLACVSGTSSCGLGSVSVFGECRSLVPLGQPCANSAQCMGFGTCSSSTCQCRSGYTAYRSVCRPSSEFNGCGSNEVLIGSQCYPTVQVGARCSYNQQCLFGSTCQSNVCVCPPNTVNYGDGSQQCKDPSQSIVYENSTATNCLYSHCPTNAHCEFSSQLQHGMMMTTMRKGLTEKKENMKKIMITEKTTRRRKNSYMKTVSFQIIGRDLVEIQCEMPSGRCKLVGTGSSVMVANPVARANRTD